MKILIYRPIDPAASINTLCNLIIYINNNNKKRQKIKQKKLKKCRYISFYSCYILMKYITIIVQIMRTIIKNNLLINHFLCTVKNIFFFGDMNKKKTNSFFFVFLNNSCNKEGILCLIYYKLVK